MKRDQLEMFMTLDGLVSPDHPDRKFEAVVDLTALSQPLSALYSDRGRPELGAERAFRMLVLQFLEDVSDREMERFMRENLAAKWFCGFGLSEKTPDHSFFGEIKQAAWNQAPDGDFQSPARQFEGGRVDPRSVYLC